MHDVTNARSRQCSPHCPSSSQLPRPMTSFASGDTGVVAARMTSSRMIGRTAELAELEAALTDAAAGRPSLVFVAGESGVGKTRILDDAARLARAAGGRPPPGPPPGRRGGAPAPAPPRR